MFSYRRRLLFPIHIEYPDEKFAAVLADAFDGPDSELISCRCYLWHSLQMKNPYIRNFLGMMAAEELGHWEMIGVLIRKLKADGLPPLSPKHSLIVQGSQPENNGEKANVVQMLKEDEERKIRSRKTYLELLNLTDDGCVKKTLRFLTRREIIHQKLIGEIINLLDHDAGNEQFADVIHEYKMSLRVVK